MPRPLARSLTSLSERQHVPTGHTESESPEARTASAGAPPAALSNVFIFIAFGDAVRHEISAERQSLLKLPLLTVEDKEDCLG